MIQPISWGPTIFNNRGTQNADKRNFIDAAYERQIAGGTCGGALITMRIHYQGRVEYPLERRRRGR